MTDYFSYLFVLALLYLCECFQRVGPEAFVFSGGQLQRPNHYPGNGTWGWVFANPLRPLDPSFPIEPSPNAALERKPFDARLTEFEPHAARLRRLAIVFAALILVVWPAAIFAFGFAPALFAAAACAYGLGIRAGFVYRRAFRQLYPRAAASELLSGTLKFMLYPMTLFWPTDALSALLLAGFDPALAVARLLPKPERKSPLLAMLRVAENPPEGRAADEARAARLRSLAAADGISLAEATAAPKRQAKDNVSWCPVCLDQFTRAEGVCGGCGGVRLNRFAKGR